MAYVKLIAWHKLSLFQKLIFFFFDKLLKLTKKKSCSPRDLNPGFYLKLFKSLKKSKTSIMGPINYLVLREERKQQ